ncbi:MAG: ABC transporter ATP-binding protein [Anaerolineales bacterium]
MSNYALITEDLSKRYYIGVHDDTPRTLVGAAKTLLREPGRRLRSIWQTQMPQFADDSIWALQDINFQVDIGEVVGIIGHNGAGKSTLLKILSRITLPTSGQARIRGRIAALLEIGTGFHEELTGRENIYLNGTILGMSKAEVDAKLEAIVDFAGVEKYLDTPVKRYSSGMRVRLGFAVAAHLEPDILLVDEVLAVGDLAFQRRSLGKMDEAARSGRTVIFISHNMQTITNLCPRTIWLHGGRIEADGETSEVIKQYTESSMADIQAVGSLEDAPRRGSGRFRYTKIEVLDVAGETVKTIAVGETLRIRLHYHFEKDLQYISLNAWLRVRHEVKEGITILSPNYLPGWAWRDNEGVIECTIERLPWVPGNYFFDAHALIDHERADVVFGAASLHVTHGDFYDNPIMIDTETVFLNEQQWTHC